MGVEEFDQVDQNVQMQQLKISKRNQFIAGMIVSSFGFCAGTVLSWTSPALITLNANTSTKISTEEQSLIAGMLMLGALLSAIPSTKCADLFGRKVALILTALFYLINFVMIACATDVVTLSVARFLAGVALGSSCALAPLYIGEIAQDQYRGLLGSLFSLLLTLGNLYTNLIGVFANWMWLAVTLAVPPAIIAIGVWTLPETPLYLVRQDHISKARQALRLYRGNDDDQVAQELIQIQKQINGNDADKATFTHLFTYRRYRKSLFSAIGVFIYQQFCGINVLVLFLLPIFNASTHPLVVIAAPNVIMLLVGILVTSKIDKRRRKHFLLTSAVCMFLGSVTLGMFFHLTDNKIEFTGIRVIPILSTVVFMGGFAIGLGPVPWVLIIELFTSEVRGVASGVIAIVNWSAAFLITFLYPYFVDIMGTACTFYLYGLFNVFGISFILFFVPETLAMK